MKETHDMSPFRGTRTWGLLAAPLLLCLLTGCGSDRPDYSSAQGPSAPEAQGVDPVDPLAVSSGGIPNAPSPSKLPDPLLNGPGQAPKDPLLRANPLMGPVMPTTHSHWLRGRLRDAHVTVLLNGIRLGEFSGVLDQDITMKLLSGVNRATFRYMPNSFQSSVNLEIVESEHNPPIAPLVTFQSGILSETESRASLPVTKTFTFIAN